MKARRKQWIYFTAVQLHIRGDILGISDPEDFPAQTADEGGRLVHRRELWDGNVCGLVHTLPVLDLIKDKPNQLDSINHEMNEQIYVSEEQMDQCTFEN